MRPAIAWGTHLLEDVGSCHVFVVMVVASDLAGGRALLAVLVEPSPTLDNIYTYSIRALKLETSIKTILNL